MTDTSGEIHVAEANDAQLSGAQRLRRAVFVDEQGVSLAQERDGRDGEAVHIVALKGGNIVGTCRLFDEGARWRLTRMAVDRELRSQGVGAAIMAEAHRRAAAAGAEEMELSAQISAQRFYAREGYEPVGERYLDAGIEHVTMRRKLDAV